MLQIDENSGADQPVTEETLTAEDLQQFNEDRCPLERQLSTEESIPLADNNSEKICKLCGALTEERSQRCIVCERTQSIKRHREDAKVGLEVQAKKMKIRSNLNFSSCEVGTTVRVPIPDVDRSKCDFRNVLMVVTAVDNEGLYTLANENGLVEQKFSRNQFTPCDAKFLDSTNISQEKVSLRQLANKQSTSGGQGFFKCICKSGC